MGIIECKVFIFSNDLKRRKKWLSDQLFDQQKDLPSDLEKNN